MLKALFFLIFVSFSAFSETSLYYRCVDSIENNKKNNFFEIGINYDSDIKAKYILDRETIDFSLMYFNKEEQMFMFLGSNADLEDFQIELYLKENKMFSYPSNEAEFKYDCLEIQSWELRYLRRIY